MGQLNPIDVLYTNCFAAFVHRAYQIAHPGKTLHPNWHIDAVCHHLQQIVEGLKPKHLVLNMPPRSLKTFIVVNCLPVWILIRDPAAEIIIASYADRLTGKSGREFRALMESEFVIRLSRGRLAHARKSTETEFETHHGGGCFLTTVGGTLTGRGGHFLIIDDPLKAGEAASPVALRNHIEWFFNTLLSRRNRPKDTPIILSMQRLHMNDLSGMLIGLGWPSLIMPAIAVEDEVFEVGGGSKHYRRKGDLLQPGWDSREELAKTKKADAYIFSAQYQQNPVPAEGVKVKREHLRSYRKHPPLERFRHIYVSCDPAGKSGPKNDYTAITVVGILDRDVYLLDVKRGHWSCLQIKRNMLAMYEKWKATRMLIETTGLGEAVRQEIVGENRYDIFGRQPKLDKPTRMDRLMAIFEGGHFFLPAHADWLAEFSTELLTFPHTDNDDQVDALMLALEDFKEREYSDLAYSGVCLDGCVNYQDNPYSAEQFSNRGV